MRAASIFMPKYMLKEPTVTAKRPRPTIKFYANILWPIKICIWSCLFQFCTPNLLLAENKSHGWVPVTSDFALLAELWPLYYNSHNNFNQLLEFGGRKLKH